MLQPKGLVRGVKEVRVAAHIMKSHDDANHVRALSSPCIWSHLRKQPSNLIQHISKYTIMAADLVHTIPNASPETAIQISQQAPPLIQATKSYPWPLSLFLSSETQDQWTAVENLFVSCLRTGDDESARKLLDSLIDRFGERNERVMAYSGMYAESKIENEKDFIEVLKEYGEALEENPANIHLQKRRIALLRSKGKLLEATSQLVQLCEVSPTDAEAWSELASIYVQQNMFEQAIFALEEVLLIMPNAWNVSSRGWTYSILKKLMES